MRSIPLYVECLADVAIAKILFASEAVEVIDCGTSSGSIARATGSLRNNPDQPIALLFATREALTPRDQDYERALTHRLILRAGTMNYHAAFAEPRPLDWVLTDEKLRRAFEASPQDMKIYIERTRRIAELAKSLPFDDSVLREQSEDYRGLLSFIRKHTASSAQASRVG